MAASDILLSELIDEYVEWFVGWHRAALQQGGEAPAPPARFPLWRNEAVKSLYGAQPAIEKITGLHEQLHRLVKLVLIKETENQSVDPKDTDSVAAKYIELIRELRRFERAFAAAASGLDPLTGLRTRLTLMQDVEREMSRSQRSKRPFFVAVMDIDHFKKVNDTYGHDGGDRVLASVADQIIRGLRAHDDAYRLGGEEFLICLKETNAEGSLLALERLRVTIEKTPIPLADGREVRVTASFGVVSSTAAVKADTLIQTADRALYSAKEQGRNRIVTG